MSAIVPVDTKPNGTDIIISVDQVVSFGLKMVDIAELNSGDNVIVSYLLNTQNLSEKVDSIHFYLM